VKHIREKHDTYFDVAVAGYPEGHPAVIKKVEEGRALSEDELTRVITMEDGQYVCSDAVGVGVWKCLAHISHVLICAWTCVVFQDYAGELAYLKQKVDAGASFIVTQVPCCLHVPLWPCVRECPFNCSVPDVFRC
jgi:hypothetical protein